VTSPARRADLRQCRRHHPRLERRYPHPTRRLQSRRPPPRSLRRRQAALHGHPANLGQYEAKLTAGSVALLKAYADYKLIVYPTRRSANNPQRIYDATKANATTGVLANNGNSFENAITGIPFPFPPAGLR